MGVHPTSSIPSTESSQEGVGVRQRWRSSRFNFFSYDDTGGLIVFNSLVGALAKVPSVHADTVKQAIESSVLPFPSGPLAELAINGFFVPEDVDEFAAADQLHAQAFTEKNFLQLIILANENCNFRCTYCYENFARGKMSEDVIDGIVRYVRSRADQLQLLRIGWFGGEPLTAPLVIEKVSEQLLGLCEQYDIHYASSMTTNGYLLSADVVDMLFKARVRRFQITLDGPKEYHDSVRILANCNVGTFDRIIANLRGMKVRKKAFDVVLRVNVSPNNIDRMDEFLDFIKKEFGGDKRFSIDFHPVGRWGGSRDSETNVFTYVEGQQATQDLHGYACDRNFDLSSLRTRMKPFGSVCYAANPHSFIIGSEGSVYKCTVAFDDPRNKVGTLTACGDMMLDREKVALWIKNGEENDAGCRTCGFRPACQGNACPLARLNQDGAASCPSIKRFMDGYLKLLASEYEQVHAGCSLVNRT